MVLQEVLGICVEAVGATGGTIYIHEPSTRMLKFQFVIPRDVADDLEMFKIADDFGVAGRVFQTGKSEISNYPKGGRRKDREMRERTGVAVESMISVPLQIADEAPVGVVQIINKVDGEFTEQDEMVLITVSDVSTLAILHSRLMEQSAQVASLQGMGRVAHDLANKAGVLMTFLPDFERNLAGLRECLEKAGVKGEACLYLDRLEGSYRDVWYPYTERVYRYARLVNDLAAGKKLEPKKKKQSFAAVVKLAVQYLESQGRKSHVALEFDLQEGAPQFKFDDLYVIRIAENLAGNAIKAVAETIPDDWLAEHADDLDAQYGKVIVRYRYRKGHHVLEFEDKGPGMSAETIRMILKGEAKSQWGKASGSGLGTKVVLDLAATHDAKVSIKSKLGKGTTFIVDFPETA